MPNRQDIQRQLDDHSNNNVRIGHLAVSSIYSQNYTNLHLRINDAEDRFRCSLKQTNGLIEDVKKQMEADKKDLNEKYEVLKQKFNEDQKLLRTEFHESHEQLRGEFNTLRGEFKTELSLLKDEFTRSQDLFFQKYKNDQDAFKMEQETQLQNTRKEFDQKNDKLLKLHHKIGKRENYVIKIISDIKDVLIKQSALSIQPNHTAPQFQNESDSESKLKDD